MSKIIIIKSLDKPISNKVANNILIEEAGFISKKQSDKLVNKLNKKIK